MNTRVAKAPRDLPVHHPHCSPAENKAERPSLRLLAAVVFDIAVRSDVPVRSRIHFLLKVFSRRKHFWEHAHLDRSK